jgi:hypothetical protein
MNGEVRKEKERKDLEILENGKREATLILVHRRPWLCNAMPHTIELRHERSGLEGPWR